MKSISKRKQLSPRSGAITAEFALALPILLAFVFASFEFGRANMIRHTAQNAAYEGARTAIVPGATAESALAVSEAMLAIVGVNDGSISITPSVLGLDDEMVTIDISVPIDTNCYIAPLFLSGRNLRASCTLNREKTGL